MLFFDFSVRFKTAGRKKLLSLVLAGAAFQRCDPEAEQEVRL